MSEGEEGGGMGGIRWSWGWRGVFRGRVGWRAFTCVAGASLRSEFTWKHQKAREKKKRPVTSRENGVLLPCGKQAKIM